MSEHPILRSQCPDGKSCPHDCPQEQSCRRLASSKQRNSRDFIETTHINELANAQIESLALALYNDRMSDKAFPARWCNLSHDQRQLFRKIASGVLPLNAPIAL